MISRKTFFAFLSKARCQTGESERLNPKSLELTMNNKYKHSNLIITQNAITCEIIVIGFLLFLNQPLFSGIPTLELQMISGDQLKM